MQPTVRVYTADQALKILTATVVSLVVIAVLYAGQKLLIPVALALFFAFVLTPVVLQLQRWGLNRIFAVLTVALLTVVVFLAFGWLVTTQVLGFAKELPKYTANIKHKMEAIHSMSKDPAWQQVEGVLQDLGLTAPAAKDNNADDNQTGRSAVVVEQAEPLWQRWFLASFGTATELLGQVGLTFVLMIFVLLAREDLRNRFMRLFGHGRLTVTTKAVDDASQRLSRFLLMQFIINIGFGVCLAVGLALIGVHYALLFGVLAAVLRYVPYVGSPIAALFPIAVSIAQFEGWLEPGLIVVFYIVLELLTANVFEPLLLGRSIGVSAVALLVAAAFWAFLWGPIGLVLSGPLTVCLVVLGKYVPQLEFLTVLLSDEPALDQDFTYYQRLSARDEDEATTIVQDYAKEHSIDEVYDALLVPALYYAGRDHWQQGLDDTDVQNIRETTREILADIEAMRNGHKAESAAGDSIAKSAQDEETVNILGIPARDESDEIALEMLRQILQGERCEMTIAGSDMLSSELLAMIEKLKPAAVCIAALPPGGLMRARLLCKRLRGRFPDLHILVGRWGTSKAGKEDENALLEAGANLLRNTLAASRADIVAWLPALAEKTTDTRPERDVVPMPVNGAARSATNGPAKVRQLT